DARDFGVELDFIVDGNAEHRAGLRRGLRADRGPDFGDEAGSRCAQRYRSGSAAGSSRLLRRCGEARQFLIFGDRIALADEQIGDPGAFLSTPTCASRRGTIKPVTRTMSEKQALVDLVTITSAWPGVSFSSARGRCSNQ